MADNCAGGVDRLRVTELSIMTVSNKNQTEPEQQLGIDLKSTELNLQPEEPLDDLFSLLDILQKSNSVDQSSTDVPQQQEENSSETTQANGTNGNKVNHASSHLENLPPIDPSEEESVPKLKSQSLFSLDEVTHSEQELQLPYGEVKNLLKSIQQLDSADFLEQPTSQTVAIQQDENNSVVTQENGTGENGVNNGSNHLEKQLPTEPSQEEAARLSNQSLSSFDEPRVCFQSSPPNLDPPQPPLIRGENSIKVPLVKGDLGGSPSLKTRPSPIPQDLQPPAGEVTSLLRFASQLDKSQQEEEKPPSLTQEKTRLAARHLEEEDINFLVQAASQPTNQESDSSALVAQQDTEALLEEGNSGDESDELAKLLKRLVDPEKLEPRLRKLEQNIYESIDELIEKNTSKNRVAMGEAIAAAIPIAITQQVSKSPKEIANSLAPEMAEAIREQVLLERDAMVDALYPVIGSTISSYIGSELRAINEQIEHAFSIDAVSRKVRARMQGVSEAELLLKETMHSLIGAIFLIHKGSGLVISEVQPSEGEKLESDMVAGMLTAIRSFANDCMAHSGNLSELDEIYYGTSRIILEAAGYCYLAVVVDGEPPPVLIKKIRKTLRKIIEQYGEEIKSYEGDPDTIPWQLHSLVESLLYERLKEKKRKPPWALLATGLAVLGLTCVPLGIYWHKRGINRSLESDIELALAYSAPEVFVYQLQVDANPKKMQLEGRVPNEYMRQKAEKIAKEVAPTLEVENKITVLDLPPDPVLAAQEVERVAYSLNQIEGVDISAKYLDGAVNLKGNLGVEEDVPDLTQTFERIPGVKSVNDTTQINLPKIDTRFYFKVNSTELKSAELSKKIPQVQEFLERYPKLHLRLKGYSDPSNLRPLDVDQSLAERRAKTIQDILIKQGIEPEKVQEVSGTIESPPGWDYSQSIELYRCVIFEPFLPTKNKQ